MGGLDELRQKLIRQLSSKGKPARSRRLSCLPLGVLLLAVACQRGDGDVAQPATAAAASRTGRALDADEALRRFREGLPLASRLEGGAPSRDALVVSFIRALEANDTAAVRRMHVSRAEYAYLYFPSSIYMNEPYRQDPALAWLLATQPSEKGIARALRRLGGHDLSFESYDCALEAREGDNAFWRECTAEYVDPQGKTPVSRRLFGSIIERDGQYKFLSYANDF